MPIKWERSALCCPQARRSQTGWNQNIDDADSRLPLLLLLSHFSRVWLFVTMNWSLSDSSAHGILQARILEWVPMPSSRGSSQARYQTWVSRIAGRFFTTEPPGKPFPHYLTTIQSEECAHTDHPFLIEHYEPPHYPLQGGSFEGISHLWIPSPGKAIKLLFSTSPKTVSIFLFGTIEQRPTFSN